MSDFFLQQFCQLNNLYSVVFEDDGRVAYAYLMENEEIIGDVWLYNQIPSPVEANWQFDEDLPFLNPKEYVKENAQPLQSEHEIDLIWILPPDKETVTEIIIYIRGKLLAKLAPGATPGWSKAVIKDGPLAKVYNY